MKKCVKCGETKPFEQFSKCSRYKDGHNSWCKACHSAVSNTPNGKAAKERWRKRNPSKVRDMERRYRENNRERINERRREYYAKNRKTINARALRDYHMKKDKNPYRLNACERHELDNETFLIQLEMDGWKIDAWGHAKKEFDGVVHRLKFQKRNIRHEIKGVLGRRKCWIRLETWNYD